MSQSTESGFSRGERGVANVLRMCQNIGMGLLVALVLLTVAHVVGRSFFKSPIFGVTEVSSFMVVSLVFLSGAYNIVINRHITIDFIVKRFPERHRAVIESFIYIICLVLAALALWQCIVRGIWIMHAGQTTNLLKIPHFPFIFVMAFGWGLFVVAILTYLFHPISKVVKK